MIEAHKIYTGKKRTIYGLVRHGHNEFIYEEDLKQHLSDSAKRRIDEYIKTLADATLPITNEAISRALSGFENLLELKSDNLRLFYFFFGRYAIICSATIKGAKKKNQAAMERAENLKRQFLSENN